ncbi:MAG: glutamate 5-kinase [Pseudomonadota bacterium]|nr:glutamate 5-kinase [Pseudomonadota bacterium]
MVTVENRSRRQIGESKRLIIKIGSALLVDEKTGKIRNNWLTGLAKEIANLKSQGTSVVVVSSGAIAVGRSHLELSSGILALEQKQASAATGQIRLAHAWQEALAHHNITVAQILLTPSDTEERRRHLNARATIETLLNLGAIPVINENDTVATEEIRYGDNDRLAARVAQMISADTLILLSDVDGLYDGDPQKHSEAKLILEVHNITPQIEAMAGNSSSTYSSGGMVTKLEAAKIAMAAGCSMAIVDGKAADIIERLKAGSSCTWFIPKSEPLTARKGWIAGSVTSSGSITIDRGALDALKLGKSLLPAGVEDVEGSFERGDVVSIRVIDGEIIGLGLSAYSSEDALLICGRKSRDIEGILGYRGRDEMVHRDDLVIKTNESEKSEQ